MKRIKALTLALALSLCTFSSVPVSAGVLWVEDDELTISEPVPEQEGILMWWDDEVSRGEQGTNIMAGEQGTLWAWFMSMIGMS